MRGNFAGLNVKKGCPWLKQRPERKQAANDQHYPLHLIIAHRSDATIFPTALVTVDRLREATCNLTYTDVDPDDQFWIALLSDDAKTAAELFREPMVSWRISRRNLFIGDCSYDTDLAAIHYPITRFGKMRSTLKNHLSNLHLQFEGAPTVSTFLSSTYGGDDSDLLMLPPPTSCARIAKPIAPLVFYTAKIVALQSGITPDAKPPPPTELSMNVSAGNNAEAESDDDAEELLLKYPVSVLFRCLVLMQQLKNAASLDIIVKLASAFALNQTTIVNLCGRLRQVSYRSRVDRRYTDARSNWITFQCITSGTFSHKQSQRILYGRRSLVAIRHHK